jgi:hypothetical protein
VPCAGRGDADAPRPAPRVVMVRPRVHTLTSLHLLLTSEQIGISRSLPALTCLDECRPVLSASRLGVLLAEGSDVHARLIDVGLHNPRLSDDDCDAQAEHVELFC